MAHGAGKTRWLDIGVIIFCGFLAATGGHIAATTIDHWLIESLGWSHLLVFSIAIVFAVFGAVGAWRYRESTRSLFAKVEQLQARASPRKALIFFVSTQSALKEIPPASGAATIDMGPGRSIELSRVDADSDAGRLGEHSRWSWEQILRGIGAHGKKLEFIYLIGSSDSESQTGSFRQLPIAAAFFEPYLKGSKIRLAEAAVDFENYASVSEALEKAIRAAKALGIGDQQICVDITGGQKPTSAAGTIATLNRDVVLQYVQTAGQKQALIYDIHYAGAPELGH